MNVLAALIATVTGGGSGLRVPDDQVRGDACGDSLRQELADEGMGVTVLSPPG